MLQVRHAELLDQVIRAIRLVSPPSIDGVDIEADHCLRADLGLGGTGLLQVCELLEDALGISLTTATILDLALSGPTVGRLVRVIVEIRQRGARRAA